MDLWWCYHFAHFSFPLPTALSASVQLIIQSHTSLLHCMPRVPPAIFRTTATAFRVTRSARPFIAYSVPVAAAIFPFTSFSTSSPNMSAPKVQKSESEWRAQLSPEQVRYKSLALTGARVLTCSSVFFANRALKPPARHHSTSSTTMACTVSIKQYGGLEKERL